MTAESLAPLAEGWTHDDIDALPDEIDHLAEIIDGNLLVSPAASAWHNDVLRVVANVLIAQAPPGIWAYGETEIRLVEPDGLVLQRPVPDVLVAPRALRDYERGWATPEEVTLVVEVESPSSMRRDRLEKPAWYARLGIPAYWRIERGVTLTEYRLNPDGSTNIVSTTTGGQFRTETPFPVTIDLDALT